MIVFKILETAIIAAVCFMWSFIIVAAIFKGDYLFAAMLVIAPVAGWASAAANIETEHRRRK